MSHEVKAIKLNQLIEYSIRNIFIQKLSRNYAELVPDLFLFLKKA